MIEFSAFEKAIKQDKVNSVLIYHQHSLVFESFRNAKMRTKQHKIYSITKSILSILIGIAVKEEYIEHVQMPINNYFPQYKNDSLTIEHLLTMTSGLHWPGNNRMMTSSNWVDFILNQDQHDPVGTKMVYSCGSSHLLSAMIEKATGQRTALFAKQHLFDPLDITQFKWNSDPKGIAIGGFGLTMKTEDLLKIGMLYLQQGACKSKQIVSANWIHESTRAKVAVNEEWSYGYHWWTRRKNQANKELFLATGLEGQYLIISPNDDLVVVINSSIKGDASRPFNFFMDNLLPHL